MMNGDSSVKAGWRTTEFWALVATSAVAILNKAFGWNIPDQAVVAIAVAVAGYALGRGLAKKA